MALLGERVWLTAVERGRAGLVWEMAPLAECGRAGYVWEIAGRGRDVPAMVSLERQY